MTTMHALQVVKPGWHALPVELEAEGAVAEFKAAEPPGEPKEEQDPNVERLVRLATAQSTHDGYQADFRYFRSWCEQRGKVCMPATPATVASYLAWCDTQRLRPNTIARRAAAIRYAHLLGRQDNPCASVEVRLVLSGARRNPDRSPPVVRDAMTAPLVKQLLDTCGSDMQGLRDRALLAIGFAGAFRRSELVALELADVEWCGDDGIKLTVRRSKTDQEGKDRTVAVPMGYTIRPVKALRCWIEAAGIVGGALLVG